jgi:hypothetical protein
MRHFKETQGKNPYIISESKPITKPVHDYRKDFAKLLDTACNYMLVVSLLGLATILTYQYFIR